MVALGRHGGPPLKGVEKMRRIISYLMLFSFLFSGSAYAWLFSAGDMAGLMPITGKWELAKKGSDPFLVNMVLDQNPTPPLDISGIAEIQKIPIGKSELYVDEDAIKILDSLANLAVMQLDVEDKKFNLKVKDPATGKEETIVGGEFGRILRKEILAFNPKREGVRVEHVEFVQTPGLTPQI